MKKFFIFLNLLLILLSLTSCTNKYSSNNDCDMIKNYYQDVYKIKDSVFNSLNYEELIYILESDGNHLILLSDNNSKINKINNLAKKYKINTIYHFEFNISEDIINTLNKELFLRYFTKTTQEDTLILYNKNKGIISSINLIEELDLFFKSLKSYELSKYTDSHYYKSIYKNKDTAIFNNHEPINYKNLTYNQLIWLLKQKGNFIILFSGAWCKNSGAVIKILNDYAVKNNLTIYTFDIKLDGNYAKKHWGISLDLSITSNPLLQKLYANLITNYLYNIETLNKIENGKYMPYTDEFGNNLKINLMQVPYLLLYNKDNNPSPIISHVEQMYTLDKTSLNYIYKEENYNLYKESVLNLLKKYQEQEKINIKDI